MGNDVYYPENFVTRLEIVWGDGFLSPGGPQEVREIVRDIDLSGRSILDIGCGTGGPAIVLAGEMGVSKILAIDVQAGLLQRGVENAKKAGVGEKVEFRLVEPGPLPFGDNTFDMIFSKDALIHFTDKNAIYREILRVLRPGGMFAASDWLGGENTSTSREWARFMELSGHNFTMMTAVEAQATMMDSGFANILARDRNSWFADLSRFELSQIEGQLRDQLIAAAGEEVYSNWRPTG